MWYSYIKRNYVEIYINNKKYIYPVKKCRSITYNNGIFYFLTDTSIYFYKNNRLLSCKETVEKYCDKIIVKDYIYVSGNDSGTMYKYSTEGEILESIKIGEHISDFSIFDDHLYILSYFNNKLTVLKDFGIIKEVFFSKMPQKIISNNFIYILLNDENYSYIYMYTNQLSLIKKFKTNRQIGNIFHFKNKIIFDGSESRIIFNENLNIHSIKKSTGINLCKNSDYPMCYNNYYLDIYNNVIYPL